MDIFADEAQTYGADFRIMTKDDKEDYLSDLLLNDTIDKLNTKLAMKVNMASLEKLQEELLHLKNKDLRRKAALGITEIMRRTKEVVEKFE